MFKKTTITETVRLNRLRWFCMYGEWKKIGFPKKSILCEFGNKKAENRPRNRWQGEVREDGRLVSGKVWKERVYNREEWKKLLRTARNHHILHITME